MSERLETLTFNSVKEYPNFMKIVVFNEPIRSSGVSRKRRKKPEVHESSIRRTRQTLEDLCLCNEFDLFCTFTFDPKRYNSKNILRCRHYMNTWIRNSKARHSPNLQYLIVPELHESGAIHFHALLKHYKGVLKDSKHTARGRTVFNIKHWHFGFSTAVKIDNIEPVSKYIRKYITKDMLLLPDKKRYFCSQNLRRPVHRTNVMLDFLRKISPDRVEFHVTQDAQFYTIRLGETKRPL